MPAFRLIIVEYVVLHIVLRHEHIAVAQMFQRVVQARKIFKGRVIRVVDEADTVTVNQVVIGFQMVTRQQINSIDALLFQLIDLALNHDLAFNLE